MGGEECRVKMAESHAAEGLDVLIVGRHGLVSAPRVKSGEGDLQMDAPHSLAQQFPRDRLRPHALFVERRGRNSGSPNRLLTRR